MKRSILWPLAIVAVLCSAQVNAVNVSFGFAVTLGRVICIGWEICSSPGPDTGTVFVTLDIADPFVDQNWGGPGEAPVVAGAIVFPELSIFNAPAMGSFEMTGTYSYDAETGLATSTLATYIGRLGLGSLDLLVSKNNGWDAFASGGSYIATQEFLFPATAVVGPPSVPIPAAAWLFGSALLGLGVVKRKKA